MRCHRRSTEGLLAEVLCNDRDGLLRGLGAREVAGAVLEREEAGHHLVLLL